MKSNPFVFATLAVLIAAQSVAMAQTASTAVDINSMTLDQLQQGVVELKQQLNVLEDDLQVAELRADGRWAVKVRNFTALSAYGYAVAIVALDLKQNFYSPDFGGSLMTAIPAIALGTVAIVVESGYMYLTNGELHAVQSKVAKTERRIGDILLKIETKKSEK